jgi:two-component system OmpR family response regulator
MRVLVVEDEPDLARAVTKTLEEEGYACDWAADGESGLFEATHVPYDVVVLDLMLPRLDGIEVLRRLRRGGHHTPVLILTALDALPEKVRGLDEGADDYLTKPFALEELLARVRALIRRSADKPSPTIDVGDVRINTSSRTVERDGEPVPLTAKEYALLELLVLKRGALVTRTAIYDHIYSDSDETLSNVVDVYVAKLRRKLGHDLIETRRGEGYRIP